jgi:hypothetical protein
MLLETKLNLGSDYYNHNVFKYLKTYIEFYDALSYSVMSFTSLGTTALNLDTYTYSSIKGTLESIRDILSKGRINDSYTLLRKYHDSTVINIYTNLFLSDHVSLENFIVRQIENWKNGTEKIPSYQKMMKYIHESPKLSGITLLVDEALFEKIRKRCNDNTHYNFYKNFLLNDNQILTINRLNYLDVFSLDLNAIFVQHFSYIFTLNQHYMSSSDYLDSLELGLTPEEDSQYWVASFIQETFDKIIKVLRPDIAEEIKKTTFMKLS